MGSNCLGHGEGRNQEGLGRLNLGLIFGRAATGSMKMKAMRRWTQRLALLFSLSGAFPAMAGAPSGLVVAWGEYNNGSANVAATVPAGLSNVTAIAAGGDFSLALLTNGTVVAWGYDNYGQTNVPAGLSNVMAIAAGETHSMALQSNGTVVAWGELSNVPPGLGKVVAIAGGQQDSLALQSNGVVVAWGYNGYGETNVPTGLSNVTAIAAGEYHSLALLSNGTVIAWGNNTQGQTNVPAGLSNVVAIAGGGYHSLALQSNGTVVAWGFNGYGQTSVPPGLSNVTAIAAGQDDSLALLSNGTVVAWGYNGEGETNVPAGLGEVSAIAAGNNHNLAIVAGPVISSEPPSPISLASGAGTNLSIAVLSGTAFGCQWSLNGGPIAGATGTNLAVTNFQFTNAGVYSVLVTNQFGSATATSVVRLTNSPVILVDGEDVGGGMVGRTNMSQITMSSTYGANANIYYTLDGSAPSYLSTSYAGAFQLKKTAVIRAVAYDSAYLLSAQAAPITVQIAPLFSLTVITPGGGSVGFFPAAYSSSNLFASNTLVTITASPSNGWSFMGWLGDLSGTNPSAGLLVNRDLAAEALFGTTVVSNALGSGQIEFSPQVPIYPFDTTVEATAVPQTGNYFIKWAGALSGSNNPNAILIASASPVVTALFGPLTAGQYALTVQPQGDGTVEASPFANEYGSGTVVTLTAVAGSGQSFTGWGGNASGSQNPLTVTMSQSQVITASFTHSPVLGLAPPLNGASEEGFRVSLTGDFGATFQIDDSTDLVHWVYLGGVTNSFGTSEFLDTNAFTNNARFYRAIAE
jgi:hypothetical protein